MNKRMNKRRMKKGMDERKKKGETGGKIEQTKNGDKQEYKNVHPIASRTLLHFVCSGIRRPSSLLPDKHSRFRWSWDLFGSRKTR